MIQANKRRRAAAGAVGAGAVAGGVVGGVKAGQNNDESATLVTGASASSIMSSIESVSKASQASVDAASKDAASEASVSAASVASVHAASVHSGYMKTLSSVNSVRHHSASVMKSLSQWLASGTVALTWTPPTGTGAVRKSCAPLLTHT
jgi:hypothetical protein